MFSSHLQSEYYFNSENIYVSSGGWSKFKLNQLKHENYDKSIFVTPTYVSAVKLPS
jgi:hypothetical protein